MTVRAGVAPIVTVTAMVVTCPPPGGASVIVAEKGPGPEGSCAGLTVTMMLPWGGFPVNCPFPGSATVNQATLSFETMKLVIPGLLLTIITVWVAAT